MLDLPFPSDTAQERGGEGSQNFPAAVWYVLLPWDGQEWP